MTTARYHQAELRLWQSLDLTPEDERVTLCRTGAAVRVRQVGDGPVVVFVHGASTAGASWAPLVARLDGYRHIVIDRPGCGLSPPLSARFLDVDALEAFADALLVDVLDALGVASASVVATSFGGYVALRSAAAHPTRIRRVIELGWPVGAPIADIPLTMRIATIAGLSRMMTSIPPTRRLVSAMLRHVGVRRAIDTGAITDEMLDWYCSLLRDTETMRNEIDAGPRLIRPLRGLDDRLLLPERLLATITAPVGFLWGEHDLYGGAATARAFAAKIPTAELEIMSDAGHAPWLDDADHAAATTRRYLTQWINRPVPV